MVRVINGKIVQHRLPHVGTLKDGRTVTGYHLLGAEILKDEGWLPLEEVEPDYPQDTHRLEVDRYEILADKVIKPYKVVPLPKESDTPEGAARIMARMQAVTMASTMTKEQLFSVRYLYPQWEELVGKKITKEETPYIMYGDIFYMVNSTHLVQAEWPPGEGTESIYSLVAEPGTVAPWVQPLGAHDAYNRHGSGLPKSDPVTHKGSTWNSELDGNIWEPGVYGWVIFTG